MNNPGLQVWSDVVLCINLTQVVGLQASRFACAGLSLAVLKFVVLFVSHGALCDSGQGRS